VSAGPQVHPAARYSADLVSRINNWLGILTSNKAIANGGTRATVTAQKDVRRETLQRKLARVRYLYCFASDAGESNPELERIGFQRKRQPGDAQPQPLPGAPATLTGNQAERTLTLPESRITRPTSSPGGSSSAASRRKPA